MIRKPHLRYTQWTLATALALGTSAFALADDSSMNPFIGDSYRYFNGYNLGDPGPVKRRTFSDAPADPAWRQSHPNGLAERDLQALSSSGLSAAAEQLNPPVVASAAADPSWRRNHPNGLSEQALQALSSSSLARWEPVQGFTSPAAATGNRNASRESPAARLARFFDVETGAQAGSN